MEYFNREFTISLQYSSESINCISIVSGEIKMENDSIMEKIGDLFQDLTKYNIKTLTGRELDWEHKPSQYKIYHDSEKILLPKPVLKDHLSFDEILRNRKSIRTYSREPLDLSEISFLLWASTGIREIESNFAFRTAPSAGALYPIETYLISHNVENLNQGIYHYNIKDHVLEVIELGDFRREILIAGMNQRMLYDASVIFVHTAIFQRSKWKYGQRAYRYIYLDAGHVVGNLSNAIAALGLGGCHIGAIFDDMVNDILKIKNTIEESAIYLTCVGKIRK